MVVDPTLNHSLREEIAAFGAARDRHAGEFSGSLSSNSGCLCPQTGLQYHVRTVIENPTKRKAANWLVSAKQKMVAPLTSPQEQRP